MKQLALALASLCLLGSSASADAPDPANTAAIKIEFIAWSSDSGHVLLKIQDPNRPGFLFQVRDVKGEVVKMGKKSAVFPSEFPPMSDEEKKFIKGIMNGKVKVDGQPVKFDQLGIAEAAHPTKTDIMLMTGQKGDELVIMGMRGERATRYDRIDVMKDKKGVVAKATQKQLVWDQDGKNFILVYNQKLESKDTPFDGDFFQVFQFKSYKVKGANSEGENE
ncbi:MAG TPA: hypothetical protein PK095_21390 [Myxococcota bacterium]|nr:hypothetical protein [Myxococcota bacterium]